MEKKVEMSELERALGKMADIRSKCLHELLPVLGEMADEIEELHADARRILTRLQPELSLVEKSKLGKLAEDLKKDGGIIQRFVNHYKKHAS